LEKTKGIINPKTMNDDDHIARLTNEFITRLTNEDFIALVTEEPSFWYDPAEIQVGYRIEEVCYFCAGLTLRLATPYQERGYRLTRLIGARNADRVSKSPLEQARRQKHPFLKIHCDELIVLPGDATYLREDLSPPGSSGYVYGRRYEQITLISGTHEEQLEVNECLIRPLTSTTPTFGAIAKEIATLLKLQGAGAVKARYFGSTEAQQPAPSDAGGLKATSKSVPQDTNMLLETLGNQLERVQLTVFCGAGISVNSGLPDALSLQRQILSQLGLLASDATAFLESGLPFESFMATLAGETDAAALFDIFALGEPNRNHRFIAACAKVGLIRTVCTTNFDLLLEQAFRLAGVSYDVFHTDAGLSTIDWASDRIRLIKLHGSIDNRE
jgi:hypothetical protein